MDMIAGKINLDQKGLAVVYKMFNKRGVLVPGVTMPNMKKIREAKKLAQAEQRRARAEERRAQASGSGSASTSSASASAAPPTKRARKGRK